MGFEAVALPFLGWLAIAGGLLLVLALTSTFLRRLPVSTSTVYLLLGVAAGPFGASWVRLDIEAAAPWFERVTEIGVVVALFVGGLKLRLPPSDERWRSAYLLAGPVMLVTIAALACLAHVLFGLDLGSSVLLGAVLAPTDPVLASAVSLSDARDRDRVRYALSGEAGLNDGMAFPFVVLALGLQGRGVGPWLGHWALGRLLWAVPAAILLGYVVGNRVGRLAIEIRHRHRDNDSPADFLALAIIALAYVGAEAVGAWGFLSVFAAGVGMRRAEVAITAAKPHPRVTKDELPPAEHVVPAVVEPRALEEPAVAAGAVVSETSTFGDTAERIVEMTLVLLVGVALGVHFDVRAVPFALALFFVIRPAAATVLLLATRARLLQRALVGWFGIRGIGSLYYLSYALRHGADGSTASEIVNLSITTVALSIVLHGISATPLLSMYERRRRGRSSAS